MLRWMLRCVAVWLCAAPPILASPEAGRIPKSAADALIGLLHPAAGPGGPARTGASAPPRPAQVVGVCAHFQQNKGILDLNLSLMRQAGVTSFRDDFSWSAVERAKGDLRMPPEWMRTITRAIDAGIEPLLILDYGNRLYDGGDKPNSPEAIEAFARYAEFVARQLKGKVRQYEVWNEWDIKIGGTTPGDAASYTRLLKAVYPRLKAVDANILVLGGAMTSGGIRKGWLEDMLRAGALEALDAVSIHSYNYSGQGRDRTPEAWRDFVEAARATVLRYSNGRDIPMYVTEMGWPTHTGPHGTSPAQSAAYLARTFLLGRTLPYLKGIWWYDFQDDGWKPDYNESNFGVVRPDLTPKPAYFALKSVAGLAHSGNYRERIDVGDEAFWALRFDGALALWNAGEGERRVVVSADRPGTPLRLEEAGRVTVERAWGRRDWAASPRAELVRNEIDLSVGENPVLLHGDVSGLSVRILPPSR